MEDSVGEEERREQGETTVKERQADEQVETGRGGGEPGEDGGFLLSAMASKIGAAMAGGNENSGEDSGGSETEDVKGKENAQGAGGEQGGGVLSALASRIGMAMSGASGNGHHHSDADDARTNSGDAVDHRKGEEDEQEEKGDEASGGGILSTMASKIGVAMSGANSGDRNHDGSRDDANTSNGDACGGTKVEEKGGRANGGLVYHIRSSLPSEDQGLQADEASLLIAIIED